MRRPERVAIDLVRVEFIDSTALGVLIEARTKLITAMASCSPRPRSRRAGRSRSPVPTGTSGCTTRSTRHLPRSSSRKPATTASAPAAARTPSARPRTSPAPSPADSEQQRARRRPCGHHPDREWPHAPGRRLDRRVGELFDREQRGRDERRAQVDLAAVENETAYAPIAIDSASRSSRPQRPARPTASATSVGAAGDRQRDAEEIGLERRPGTDRREEQQRRRCGQRAFARSV